MLVAIITARGGSKGLPGKNIKKLNNLPLIAYTIIAAKESAIFDKILVTTDCDEIAKISVDFGADIIMRPPNLAQDTSSSYDAVKHVINVENDLGNVYTTFILLQPTSPLRSAEHIIEAYHLYLQKKALSVLSVVETASTPFKYLLMEEESASMRPLFAWDDLSKPRQSFPKTYEVNGAIYISDIEAFFHNKSFFSCPTEYYVMDRKSSIDIDTSDDLHIAEYYVSKG